MTLRWRILTRLNAGACSIDTLTAALNETRRDVVNEVRRMHEAQLVRRVRTGWQLVPVHTPGGSRWR